MRELKRPGLNFSQEHGSIFASGENYRASVSVYWCSGFLTDWFFGMEVHRCHRTLVTGQLTYRKTGYDQCRSEGAVKHTLYKILELSTSHIVTVRSAPPTATRRPPSSRLQAPLRSVFSKPAGAPLNTRWTRFGEGANGRIS